MLLVVVMLVMILTVWCFLFAGFVIGCVAGLVSWLVICCLGLVCFRFCAFSLVVFCLLGLTSVLFWFDFFGLWVGYCFLLMLLC